MDLSIMTVEKFRNLCLELYRLYPQEHYENYRTLKGIDQMLHDPLHRPTLLTSHEARKMFVYKYEQLIKIPSALRYKIEYLMWQDVNNWHDRSLEDLVASITNSPTDGEQQITLWPNMSKFDDASDMFYDAMENVNDHINNIGPAVTKLVENMDSFTNSGKEFLDSFKTKYVDQTNNDFIFISKLKQNWLPILMNVVAISRATSMEQIGYALFNIGSNLGVVDNVLQKVMDFMTTRKGEQQSFDNTKKLATLAITMMTKFSPNAFVSSFSGKLNNTTKDIEAMDKLMDMLDDTLAEWGFDVSSKARVVKALQETLAEAINKEAEFRSMLATKPASFNDGKVFKDFMTQLKAVRGVQSQLNQTSFRMFKDTAFVNSTNQLKISYEKMYNRILEIRSAAGARICPACFIAVGKPGIGKTVWLSELLQALQKRYEEKFADKDEFARFDDIGTWTQWDQTVTDDYHQGYIGQEVHVANELFQSADDKDHADFLRFISMDTFLTVQAALEDKGKPYEAKLYVGSANNIPKTSKTINKIEALWRRMKVLYVTPKKVGAYKELDPDDLTITDDDCAYDTDFTNLKIRILTAQEYHAILAGTIPTREGARERTHEEILDYMIRDMRIKDAQFRSSSARKQQVGTEPYNTQNVLHFAQEFSDLMDITKNMTDENGHATVYRKLRRLRITIDDTDLLLADAVANHPEYKDFSLLAPILMKLKLPRLSDDETVIMRSGLTYWAWQGERVFETQLQGEWMGRPQKDAETDPGLEAYLDDKFGQYSQRVFKVYQAMKWFQPFFTPIRVAGAYFAGWKVTAPLSLVNISVMMLLLNMYWPEDGAVHEVPGYKFWTLMWDSTVGVISIGFLGWLLYQCVRAWTKVAPHDICGACATSLEDGLGDLQELCEVSCGNVHSDRCRARQIASRQMCAACDEGKCSQSCFHAIEATPEDLDLGQQELDRMLNFNQESSPKKFSTRKTKMRLESSPKKFSTRKTKMKIGNQEYSYGGHNPGDQIKPRPKPRVGDQEMVHDPNGLNIAISLGDSLCVQVGRYKEIDGELVCHGGLFGIGHGRQMLTPAHLHMSSDPSLVYMATRDTKDGKKEYIKLKLHNKNQRRDLAVWDFMDATDKPFKTSLRGHLLSRSEMENQIGRDRAAFYYIPTSRLIQNVYIHYRHQDRFVQGNKIVDYDKVYVVTGMTYNSPNTVRGDCGGLLVANDTSLQKKILGLHVVGTSDNALATIVTTDDLIELGMNLSGSREEGGLLCMEDPGIVKQNVSDYPIVDHLNLLNEEAILDNGERPFLAPGDFTYLGEIDMCKPSSKTTLHKSPLYGTFPVTTTPAITDEKKLETTEGLVKNGFGYPDLLLTQVAKYGKTFKPLEKPEYLKIFIEELSDYFALEMADEDLGLSTEYEILNGDIGEEASHPLDMRTSAGVPWMNVGKGKGKKKMNYCRKVMVHDEHGIREYFEFNDNQDYVQALRKAINSAETHAKEGRRVISVCKDCLKDEPRSFEKAHKPRAFKSFPLEKLYLFRKYFLKFKTQWTKRRERFFHGVGVNVMSTQWTALYDYLASVSKEGADADYKEFDGNLRPEFMDASNEIIIQTILKVAEAQGIVVPAEDILVMRVLLDELPRSISVAKTTVYMDTHGNPSGSPLTTVTNCIVNLLYHWYCFARITGMTGLAEFARNVAILCFGDDVAQTFNKLIGYDFDSVQRIMVGELGQTYTTAAKTSTGGTMSIDDLTFLKRKFVRKDGSSNIILSPIEPDSIYQRFNWTHLKFEETEGHINVLEESLIEAAQHGPQFYQDFIGKMKDGIRALRSNLDFPVAARKHLADKLFKSLDSYSTSSMRLLARYQ